MTSKEKLKDSIIVRGASQNNLRNVDIDIPKHKLVVVTGVSGSGKSSLAFDTVYAEGYRRYTENLSSHSKFFLQSMKKPKVKKISNLSPAIAINQKSDALNPRSTVGTVTDIYNFLRILYAEIGKPYCPDCGEEMKKQNEKTLIEEIKKMEDGTQIVILGAWKGAQKKFEEKINSIAQQGFARVRVDGEIKQIESIKREKDSKKQKDDVKVEVVVDRMGIFAKKFDRERIVDSLQTAAKISKGEATILVDGEDELKYSEHFQCGGCSFLIKNITSKNFSFNSPEGACEKCSGLGLIFEADLKKIIPNKNISINEGAIVPWNRGGDQTSGKEATRMEALKFLAKKYRFSLNIPVKKIPAEKLEKVLYGDSFIVGKKRINFKGVLESVEKEYQNTTSSFVRRELERYLIKAICPECKGERLKKTYLNVKILDKGIGELVKMEIEKLTLFLKESLKVSTAEAEDEVRKSIFEEILARLESIEEVGLGYLNMNRSNQTLSNGEFQRLRLATQLNAGLSDVLYVLDEPSVGLHARDTKKLIKSLKKLRDNGNSVIVVEHDRDIILAADYLIDVGPGAGEEGGRIIFEGEKVALKKAKTKTAEYLFAKKQKREKEKRKSVSKKSGEIIIKGASENNLKNINVSIPLRGMVSFVGVSGSGKSSLVNEILAKALRKKIHRSLEDPGGHKKIEGINDISKVVIVDQSSIGRSPRSNAATYTGIFEHIRKLFAGTDLAKKKGFSSSYFSFNIKGGRCEYCQGEGTKKIEMHLLDDVYTECDHCGGTRYSKKILEVKYHGVNIADVLDMTVDYAYHFFETHPLISVRLKSLKEVGLGYLRLGQSATELSGGEAQRIKLATELARKSKGETCYILDEPTVGLHFSDVDKLLKVLKNLVRMGNSVFVVEHNLDVMMESDWVIELGPEGGKRGGEVVFEGKPEDIKKAGTWTSQML